MPTALIPILFLVLPVVEIAVFILVGSRIGVLATLLLVLAAAIGGAMALRRQGSGALSRIRAQIEAGGMPGRELGDAAMIVVAGVLLIMPGFVTDIAGIMLFLPPVRDRIWRFVSSKVTVVAPFGEPGRTGGAPRGGVVDLDPDEFSVREPRSSGPGDSPWLERQP